MNELVINKDVLLKVFSVIEERLSFYMEDSLEIDQDYYYNIPMSDAYDVLNDAKVTIGSLRDDWVELERLVGSEKHATLIDFDRFAALLKAISEEISSR